MPVTLVLPDLARLANAVPRLPALETLLARAHRLPAPQYGLDGLLAACFGLPSAVLAIAALTRLADTGARDTACWFRADPVHLAADRDQLVMLPLPTLDVQAEEAQALAGTFNRLYADDGFRIEMRLPSRWYLRVPENMNCVTHDPARVAGGPVFDFMPSGVDAPRLKQLMNEMQMLFHEHPVNQAREAAGKPVINTAWLWGGGSLPQKTTQGSQRVLTDMPLVRGLALFTGSQAAEWPGSLEAVMAAQSGLLALQVEDVMAAAKIETQVVRPLLTGLRRGDMQTLDIYPGGPTIYRLTRAALYRFWRRRRALAELPGMA
ncbi:MAG TPA: hypothetical protein VFX47_08105 [Gammaproteobacteria bacterium]|nr:hypothetical protein [Gammaproteobacteria bacterium]